MNNTSITAIIVAGGTGTRMGADCPKQFLKLGDCEIIEHTVSRFIQSGAVDEIIIVCHKDYISHCSNLFKGVDFDIKIVEGSDTRQKSVCAGLGAAGDCGYVMIHDAVRCCVKPSDIRLVADNLFSKKACALGVKVIDTVKKSDADGKILSTVDRSNLWLIQTPQAFSKNLIVKAHELAIQKGFEATDDCAVAEFAGNDVYIIEGSYTNIKITTPVDMILAGEYLKG